MDTVTVVYDEALDGCRKNGGQLVKIDTDEKKALIDASLHGRVVNSYIVLPDKTGQLTYLFNLGCVWFH